MFTSLGIEGGPFIIRYPRGAGEGVSWRETAFQALPIGKGERLVEGERVAILAAGPVANRAVEAALAYGREYGRTPAVYDVRFIKPLDTALLEEAGRFSAILTLEEGCVKGGLFGAVSEYFAGRPEGPVVKCAGIPDHFIMQGTQPEERSECSLDTEGILEILSAMMKK